MQGMKGLTLIASPGSLCTGRMITVVRVAVSLVQSYRLQAFTKLIGGLAATCSDKLQLNTPYCAWCLPKMNFSILRDTVLELHYHSTLYVDRSCLVISSSVCDLNVRSHSSAIHLGRVYCLHVCVTAGPCDHA